MSNAERKESTIAPPGYFEFTKPQKTPSELNLWRRWFKRKGIATVVCEAEVNGKLRYVLCREGVEAV